jgi:hypothetical protein
MIFVGGAPITLKNNMDSIQLGAVHNLSACLKAINLYGAA